MDQDFQRRLPMLLNERESFIFHNTAKHKRNNITFVVRSGVRQGGILSPILFNVYVNDLVNNLVDKDCGCHVGSVFFGCFIYADDVILLSPSLIGLQAMLDVCACYSNTHDIIFESK